MLVMDISRDMDLVAYRAFITMLTDTKRRDWAIDNYDGNTYGYCGELIRELNFRMSTTLWVLTGIGDVASVSAYEE